MAHPEIRERRGGGNHVQRGDLVAAQGQADSVVVVWFVEAGDAHPSSGVEDGRDADGQLGFDRRDVERVAHRHFQGEGAVVTLVVVQRRIGLEAVGAAAQGKDHRLVEDGAHHVEPAALDRRRVRHHLERRSRLPRGGRRHVDLATRAVVIGTADHGQHFAVLRIHCHQGAIVEVVIATF